MEVLMQYFAAGGSVDGLEKKACLYRLSQNYCFALMMIIFVVTVFILCCKVPFLYPTKLVSLS